MPATLSLFDDLPADDAIPIIVHPPRRGKTIKMEEIITAAEKSSMSVHVAKPIKPCPHRLAFVAALRYYNLADGQFFARFALDPREADRMANHLIRGVASDKPTMTRERWGEARVMLQADDAKQHQDDVLIAIEAIRAEMDFMPRDFD
jgi:hypothetical protein